MALLLVQPGVQPAGEFDLADGYTLKGGEVMVLYSTGTALGSDGNSYQVVKARTALTADITATGLAFYLADDGLKGYGVYFGNTVVKTDTGFASGSDTATRLGPPSYAASKKVTLWDKPGMYAVTADALADSAATLRGLLPGALLTVNNSGQLISSGTSAANYVAKVIQFKQDESLVTTFGAVVSNLKLLIQFCPR